MYQIIDYRLIHTHHGSLAGYSNIIIWLYIPVTQKSPYERDSFLGVPLESQTKGPQTTNLPFVDQLWYPHHTFDLCKSVALLMTDDRWPHLMARSWIGRSVSLIGKRRRADRRSELRKPLADEFFPTARRSDEWRLFKRKQGRGGIMIFFLFKWFFLICFYFIFWCQNMLGDIPIPPSCRCLHQGFDALMPSRGLIGGDWWRRQKQKKQRPGGVFWMKVQRELHRTTTLKINQLRWCAWRGFSKIKIKGGVVIFILIGTDFMSFDILYMTIYMYIYIYIYIYIENAVHTSYIQHCSQHLIVWVLDTLTDGQADRIGSTRGAIEVWQRGGQAKATNLEEKVVSQVGNFKR